MTYVPPELTCDLVEISAQIDPNRKAEQNVWVKEKLSEHVRQEDVTASRLACWTLHT